LPHPANRPYALLATVVGLVASLPFISALLPGLAPTATSVTTLVTALVSSLVSTLSNLTVDAIRNIQALELEDLVPACQAGAQAINVRAINIPF
jgi:hypothetical protein